MWLSKKIGGALLLVTALMGNSCKKLLEEHPQSGIVPAFFNTPSGVLGGIAGVYDDIRAQWGTEGFSAGMVAGTDEHLSGASASTGVPLTARGLATGVRILTYYQDTAIADDAWKHLASFEDTLVFYMTGNALPQLINKLLQHGADASIPFLVIEQATTPGQFVHEFTLGNYNSSELQIEFISPSLVIMGKVTALYKQFAWLPNNIERTHYFKPLQDHPELISLINNIQQSSHVSRA